MVNRDNDEIYFNSIHAPVSLSIVCRNLDRYSQKSKIANFEISPRGYLPVPRILDFCRTRCERADSRYARAEFRSASHGKPSAVAINETVSDEHLVNYRPDRRLLSLPERSFDMSILRSSGFAQENILISEIVTLFRWYNYNCNIVCIIIVYYYVTGYSVTDFDTLFFRFAVLPICC